MQEDKDMSGDWKEAVLFFLGPAVLVLVVAYAATLLHANCTTRCTDEPAGGRECVTSCH